MRIDNKRCVGCANCVPICPMGAIYIGTDRRANVNLDECVECYTCYRGLSTEHLPPWLVRFIRQTLRLLHTRFEPDPDVCPTAAIVPEELAWPRMVRRTFSDPQCPHESTGGGGRGTEEIKTNDVTGRVKVGETGFCVELGRPSVGARFRDVERLTKALANKGIEFEVNNPVTYLMTNVETGEMRSDILDEKIMSCIVEFKANLEQVPTILKCVEEVATQVDTVVSVGVSTRYDSEANNLLEGVLKNEGYDFFRGKTNLGLGRPLYAGGE